MEDALSMPRELAGIQDDGGAEKSCAGFIGSSPPMIDLYGRIEKAARSRATVFITGETGTGKELCAEAVHRRSARSEKPFVALNCAAIPRDLMESELFGHVKGAFTGAIADRDGAARLADGGTLFLDEIAEMAPEMQTKLLRFLQDCSFMKVGSGRVETIDVRIICATNRDPRAEIAAGRFREDLFYRLHVLPLHMPPLRARGDDVIDIAQTLLRRYAEEEGKELFVIDPEAGNAMRLYGWPGNIRELQNVIRHAVVMHGGDILTADMLPPDVLAADSGSAPDSGIKSFAEAERGIIEEAIRRCRGNIPEAAAQLEISPSTIYRKKAAWDKAPRL